MLHDFFIWVAELLFQLTGGVLLMNSIWFFPWIILGAVFVSLPMTLPICTGNAKFFKYAPIIFLISFIPSLLLVIGPPITQMKRVSDCKPAIEMPVQTEKASTTLKLQECRYKDNFYGDFGPWKLSTSQ